MSLKYHPGGAQDHAAGINLRPFPLSSQHSLSPAHPFSRIFQLRVSEKRPLAADSDADQSIIAIYANSGSRSATAPSKTMSKEKKETGNKTENRNRESKAVSARPPSAAQRRHQLLIEPPSEQDAHYTYKPADAASGAA